MIQHWEARFDLSDIFAAPGERLNLAVYGAGKRGEEFIDVALRQPTCSLKYVIDVNPNAVARRQVPVIHPDMIPAQEPVDLIVITPHCLADDFSFRREIADKAKCKAVFLHETIVGTSHFDWLCKAIRHVNASGAVMVLLNLENPLARNRNPSLMEKILSVSSSYENTFNRFKYDPEFFNLYYGDLPRCDEELRRDLIGSPARISLGGVTYSANHRSKYINVVNHMRITTNTPEKHDARIRLFGNCAAFGCFAPDDMTTASQLQRLVNDEPVGNRRYRVETHANGANALEAAKQICGAPVSPGDCVLLINRFGGVYSEHYSHLVPPAHFFDLTSALERPHEMGELFLDAHHVTHRGYTLLARRIHGILRDLAKTGTTADAHVEEQARHVPVKRDSSAFAPGAKMRKQPGHIPELDRYLQSLKPLRRDDSGVSGSIVMNCNPFTNGHGYLIGEALKNCDHLFVFVVEEDRSDFKFSDRFEMVRRGTADMGRVTVVPSGSFILSNNTLPEYFTKESKPNVVVDATEDLDIFGAYIAPALGISKRFVGDEPTCKITRQYNAAMGELLPGFGIEVVVFERAKVDDRPISASWVRELIKCGRLDDIFDLVPKSTFEYLKKMGY